MGKKSKRNAALQRSKDKKATAAGAAAGAAAAAAATVSPPPVSWVAAPVGSSATPTTTIALCGEDFGKCARHHLGPFQADRTIEKVVSVDGTRFEDGLKLHANFMKGRKFRIFVPVVVLVGHYDEKPSKMQRLYRMEWIKGSIDCWTEYVRLGADEDGNFASWGFLANVDEWPSNREIPLFQDFDNRISGSKNRSEIAFDVRRMNVNGGGTVSLAAKLEGSPTNKPWLKLSLEWLEPFDHGDNSLYYYDSAAKINAGCSNEMKEFLSSPRLKTSRVHTLSVLKSTTLAIIHDDAAGRQIFMALALECRRQILSFIEKQDLAAIWLIGLSLPLSVYTQIASDILCGLDNKRKSNSLGAVKTLIEVAVALYDDKKWLMECKKSMTLDDSRGDHSEDEFVGVAFRQGMHNEHLSRLYEAAAVCYYQLEEPRASLWALEQVDSSHPAFQSIESAVNITIQGGPEQFRFLSDLTQTIFYCNNKSKPGQLVGDFALAFRMFEGVISNTRGCYDITRNSSSRGNFNKEASEIIAEQFPRGTRAMALEILGNLPNVHPKFLEELANLFIESKEWVGSTGTMTPYSTIDDRHKKAYCLECGKVGCKVTCGGCRSAQYCSDKCLMAHWHTIHEEICGQLLPPPRCEVCKEEATFHCSICSNAHYCGDECQRTHWVALHKYVCPYLSRRLKKCHVGDCDKVCDDNDRSDMELLEVD